MVRCSGSGQPVELRKVEEVRPISRAFSFIASANCCSEPEIASANTTQASLPDCTTTPRISASTGTVAPTCDEHLAAAHAPGALAHRQLRVELQPPLLQHVEDHVHGHQLRHGGGRHPLIRVLLQQHRIGVEVDHESLPGAGVERAERRGRRRRGRPARSGRAAAAATLPRAAALPRRLGRKPAMAGEARKRRAAAAGRSSERRRRGRIGAERHTRKGPKAYSPHWILFLEAPAQAPPARASVENDPGVRHATAQRRVQRGIGLRHRREGAEPHAVLRPPVRTRSPATLPPRPSAAARRSARSRRKKVAGIQQRAATPRRRAALTSSERRTATPAARPKPPRAPLADGPAPKRPLRRRRAGPRAGRRRELLPLHDRRAARWRWRGAAPPRRAALRRRRGSTPGRSRSVPWPARPAARPAVRQRVATGR